MQGFFARFNIQLTFNVASIIAAYGFLQMFSVRQLPPGGAIEIQRGGVMDNRGGEPAENRRGHIQKKGGGGIDKQKDTNSNN